VDCAYFEACDLRWLFVLVVRVTLLRVGLPSLVEKADGAMSSSLRPNLRDSSIVIPGTHG
jgi:hypothetical protein